jgi:hypothetical protein
MAGRRRFLLRQGLLRARPVPGPALHRDRPPRRAGDGRPGHLCHHRRPGQGPHRYPGAAPGPARPAATAGTRHDPADHPGDQAAARRPHHPDPAPAAGHPLGRLDPPPPSPLTMVPQTHQTRPPARIRPGQTVKCGCLLETGLGGPTTDFLGTRNRSPSLSQPESAQRLSNARKCSIR